MLRCMYPRARLVPYVVQGWTRVFTRVTDVGLGAYLGYFLLYMTSVEFGVYWMHRLLHDIRPGYKCDTESRV